MSAESVLKPILATYLTEEDSLETAFAKPQSDLFHLGLDSMGAFALIDDLAAAGVEVEFTELVTDPTVQFLSSKCR